jgi:diamine N-acetyltransferase
MSDHADVVLGPLVETDSETLFKWINDRDLVLNSGPYQPVGSLDHRRWFDAAQGRPDAAIFAVREPGGRLLGTCQLVNRSAIHQSAELQIRIGESGDRGRGVGTAAVRRLLEFGFRDWNLHRVQLFVIAGNERALRTYEKCGFRREGILREAVHVDGSFRDLLVMGVLRDET